MDEERLKRAGAGNYFEDLLDRIRDIRSSERVFWRKALDIYASQSHATSGLQSAPAS